MNKEQFFQEYYVLNHENYEYAKQYKTHFALKYTFEIIVDLENQLKKAYSLNQVDNLMKIALIIKKRKELDDEFSISLLLFNDSLYVKNTKIIYISVLKEIINLLDIFTEKCRKLSEDYYKDFFIYSSTMFIEMCTLESYIKEGLILGK